LSSDDAFAGGEGRANRLPKAARITVPDEIRALFRRGKRRKTRHLDVFLNSSPVPRSRLGVIVPKHRHGSVERNRLKRRLREIGRTELLPRLDAMPAASDLMVRARAEAYGADYADLRSDLIRLVEEMCSNAG
jgi:ribonuclease P protein component